MDFRSRVFFVSPAISLRRSLNADFYGTEIGPAGTRFAAERAVAIVDEVWSLWDFDADSAAEEGELIILVLCQEGRLFGSGGPGSHPLTAVSTSAAPGTKCQIFTTSLTPSRERAATDCRDRTAW